MELRHWQREESVSSESGDSGDGMHDENCAGCLRIVKEEEERLRSWQENERVVEAGTGLEGEHATLLLCRRLAYRGSVSSPYKCTLRAADGCFVDGRSSDLSNPEQREDGPIPASDPALLAQEPPRAPLIPPPRPLF